jgi:CspA family cold shock protein
MQTGTVKRFNKIKGYGFITPDNDNVAEIFIHFSEVEMSGYKELKENQRISYLLMQGEKGPYATQVKIIEI